MNDERSIKRESFITPSTELSSNSGELDKVWSSEWIEAIAEVRAMKRRELEGVALGLRKKVNELTRYVNELEHDLHREEKANCIRCQCDYPCNDNHTDYERWLETQRACAEVMQSRGEQ